MENNIAEVKKAAISSSQLLIIKITSSILYLVTVIYLMEISFIFPFFFWDITNIVAFVIIGLSIGLLLIPSISNLFRAKYLKFFGLFFSFLIINFILVFIYQALHVTFGKPVIYLYPNETQKINVRLDYKGTLIADYPDYNFDKQGWEVTASPDGKLIAEDGKEYNYLFWEGVPDKKVNFDLSTGFVVPGKDSKEFLQNTLSKMGLTPEEYNEFIVYWYPKMQNNNYNLIHFAEKEYTDVAPLTINPQPDSILRVFMVFKPLNGIKKITPQEIKPFDRKGFTVVEWGGTEL